MENYKIKFREHTAKVRKGISILDCVDLLSKQDSVILLAPYKVVNNGKANSFRLKCDEFSIYVEFNSILSGHIVNVINNLGTIYCEPRDYCNYLVVTEGANFRPKNFVHLSKDDTIYYYYSKQDYNDVIDLVKSTGYSYLKHVVSLLKNSGTMYKGWKSMVDYFYNTYDLMSYSYSRGVLSGDSSLTFDLDAKKFKSFIHEFHGLNGEVTTEKFLKETKEFNTFIWNYRYVHLPVYNEEIEVFSNKLNLYYCPLKEYMTPVDIKYYFTNDPKNGFLFRVQLIDFEDKNRVDREKLGFHSKESYIRFILSKSKGLLRLTKLIYTVKADELVFFVPFERSSKDVLKQFHSCFKAFEGICEVVFSFGESYEDCLFMEERFVESGRPLTPKVYENNVKVITDLYTKVRVNINKVDKLAVSRSFN